MDLTIRRDEDAAVLVGAPPAAPAGAGRLLLAGAEVYVDPTAPDLPPPLVVHDLDAAYAALELLHGAPVAAAAARVGAGGPAETASASAGPAAAPVRELCLLRWLEANSPDQLSRPVLDLEFGVAAAAAADVLAESEEQAARHRLLRHTPLTVALAERLGDPVAVPTRLRALVGAALAATAAALPLGSPHERAVHDEWAVDRWRRASDEELRLSWPQLRLRPELGRRDLVAAMDGDPGDPARGVGSVDWQQVPRGLLDTAEDTVSWELDAAGIRVAVRARPGPAAEGADRLAFRVYDAGTPFPVALGRLRPSDDGRLYTGSAPLLGPTPTDVTVDVHDTRIAGPPRVGLDGVTATGLRWAARAVSALRLAAPTADADRPAGRALQQAERLFARVADGAPAGLLASTARRRQARCAALRLAVLRRADPAGAERLAAVWAAAAPPVRPADREPPDLAGPGWRPLAVEAALGAPAALRELWDAPS